MIVMGLPEELYFAMLGVGWQAKRHKIPDPLARCLIDTAQESLDLWQQDEQAAIRFSAMCYQGRAICGVSPRSFMGRSLKPVGD